MLIPSFPDLTKNRIRRRKERQKGRKGSRHLNSIYHSYNNNSVTCKGFWCVVGVVMVLYINALSWRFKPICLHLCVVKLFFFSWRVSCPNTKQNHKWKINYWNMNRITKEDYFTKLFLIYNEGFLNTIEFVWYKDLTSWSITIFPFLSFWWKALFVW